MMKNWENMQIFIMRHGQASDIAAVDAERPLTEHGVGEVMIMANWLKSLALEFDHILVSPFKRAQQTVNTLKLLLSNSRNATTLDFITPSGSACDLHDYLDGLCVKNENKTQRVLIVSHMPLVSYLVAELTSQRSAPIFQTAAIAEINYDEQQMIGTLQQIISPNDLA
jgi:phosphohistidine phosphatase